MQRIVEKLLRRGYLNYLALINNAYAVRDIADYGQVVGDEHVGRTLLRLELVHKVQYLRSDGDVQRGDGFVRDDEFRLHDHCSGESHALALAARELVRIAGQVLGQQADGLDYPFHLADAVSLVLVEVEVIEALGDDIIHRRALVQRGRGVLEHHLDVADYLAVQAVRYFTGYPDALVEYLAVRAGVGAYDGAAYSRLAGAGLAHERKCLALVDIKAHILHGADAVLALAEVYVHVPEREQYFPAAFVHRAVLREMVRAGVQGRGVFLFSHA